MAERLEGITGCMFSGKTEELLRRVERARIARKEVLVVKPEIDTRYACDEVVTHFGRSFPCHRIPVGCSLPDFKERFRMDLVQAQAVAFDEAHFFGGGFPALCEQLVAMGKRVIVAGLDLNYREEPFGSMPQILALADEVVKLTAVCTVCGEPATRSQRLANGKPVTGGPEIQIGGLESYEPRCREHYVSPLRTESFLFQKS